MSSTNKGHSPESFGGAFRQAARESLVKNQRERRSDIVSIAPIQLTLAALAIGMYVLWNSWLCLVPLGVVLVLMWVRYTMQRQISRDFAQLDAARTAWRKTRDRQYLEFMAENAGRILKETRAGVRRLRIIPALIHCPLPCPSIATPPGGSISPRKKCSTSF